MNNIEKNVKEIVNTGLGAIGDLEASLNDGKSKAQAKIEETQNQVKKYFDTLQLKGATDDSELAVKVRGQVKELFETLDNAIKNVDEFTNTNYAKLKLELGKYDISLPEYKEVSEKINSAIAEGKSKVEGLLASFKKEKVDA